MQTSNIEARPTESSDRDRAMESNEIQEETKETINSTVDELIEVDSNENKDTSNLASEIQAASPPKKSHHNGNNIMLDSEVLLVNQ